LCQPKGCINRININQTDLFVHRTFDGVMCEAVGVEAVHRHGFLFRGGVKVSERGRPNSERGRRLHAAEAFVRGHPRPPPAQQRKRLAPRCFTSAISIVQTKIYNNTTER